ncbi:antitoxin Xre/MbcA/ParS toxin-binding domain-containing protein [Rhodoferax sp. BLA1]|uniref:antitoxin Xre/MbcA/ParS toxin-binding domain-containing protein n=1 Tax=Rhodoferax sp. BLA1 TaxID=2576062 RepID=UPI0015D28573|nr:antitoxin Xre/MbcA/ParS toxin-binding domain-containing protein [Rhodoferax sp. BLA1]
MITGEPSSLPSAKARSKARSTVWGYVASAGSENAPLAPLVRGDIKFGRFSSEVAHKIVKRGISSKAIDPLSEVLRLPKGVLVQYLDLDRTTANRRAAKGLLLPTHSAEGMLRLLELDEMAADIFETEDEASQWLLKPHPMLDGETPMQTAASAYGMQRVKDILVAIKYGGVV